MGESSPSLESPGGVIRKAGSVLVFRTVTIALQAVAAVIAARYLGAQGRGVVAAASTGPALVALALFLGMGVANVYFVARDEVRVAVALGTSLGVVFVVGVVVAPLYVGAAMLLRGSLFHGLPTVYIVLGGLAIPAALAVRYVSAVAQGLQRIALLNSVTVVQAATILALYIVFLLGMGEGPLAAFTIVLVANLVGLVPVLVVLTRDHGRWRFEKEYAKRAVRFGAKGEASNLITFLGYRVDLLIVTGFLGFAAAGHYVVAFTAVELLWVVPNALGVVLFPRVAASTVGGNEQAVETTAQIVRLTTLLLLAFAVAGAAMAPLVVPLVFSSQFQASVVPLELLVPGVVLFGLGKVLSADLAGRGRPGITTLANALGLLVMVALDLVMIPSMGVPGAALASSIAYAVVFVFQARIFTRITGVPVRSLVLVRGRDVTYVRTAAADAVRRARRRVGSVRTRAVDV